MILVYLLAAVLFGAVLALGTVWLTIKAGMALGLWRWL